MQKWKTHEMTINYPQSGAPCQDLALWNEDEDDDDDEKGEGAA